MDSWCEIQTTVLVLYSHCLCHTCLCTCHGCPCLGMHPHLAMLVVAASDCTWGLVSVFAFLLYSSAHIFNPLMPVYTLSMPTPTPIPCAHTLCPHPHLLPAPCPCICPPGYACVHLHLLLCIYSIYIQLLSISYTLLLCI